MPRKRKTQAQKTRAKPKLKDSDENNGGLSVEEKKKKLERYLDDFDMQVESTLKKFMSEEVVIKRLIRKHFSAMLLEFSARHRKMTVRDYCTEMEIEKLEEAESGESADQFPDTLPQRPTQSLLIREPIHQSERSGSINQTLSKYRSRKMVIDTIPEEGGTMTTTQKKTRKGTRTGQGVTFNADPPSTLQKNSRFVTPMNQRNLSAIGMNTPLITPKFDPRLPITPAQKRQPRAGETIISLAGSPIQGPKDRTITIPIPEGQEFDDLLDQYSLLEELQITESTKSQMTRIVNALTSMVKAQRQAEKNS